MIARLAARNPGGAARVLLAVFGHLPGDFAFRLWDGTVVAIGAGPPAFTVAMHAPETFARLLRDPSPMRLAEAYVEGALDIEGDIFSVMPVADAVEGLTIPLTEQVRLLATLLRD